LGGIVPISNEVAVRHTNTHAICSILDLCFMKDKDQVRNMIRGVPTVDIGLVDFRLPEKKLILDYMTHFIRMELWDGPSRITIVSKDIEVVDLEERALVPSSQSMQNIVVPSLGDIYHSPELLCIVINGDGDKVSYTDGESNIVAEDAQRG
jgi:hypothetical protein